VKLNIVVIVNGGLVLLLDRSAFAIIPKSYFWTQECGTPVTQEEWPGMDSERNAFHMQHTYLSAALLDFIKQIKSSVM
jgi:hypothetical protein